MNKKGDTGNLDLDNLIVDIVNAAVRQKGGKLGIVKSVDETSLSVSVDPDDKSAAIVGARLSAGSIPKVGSVVAVLPTHMESEEENSWEVVSVRELKSWRLKIESELIVELDENGTIKLGAKDASEPGVLGSELVNKLDTIINLVQSHIHPLPGSPPDPFAPIDLTSIKSEKVFLI